MGDIPQQEQISADDWGAAMQEQEAVTNGLPAPGGAAPAHVFEQFTSNEASAVQQV